MLQLEQGAVFKTPTGDLAILAVTLLAWIGDHQELNDLTYLYPATCRRCYKQKDENSQWKLRTKEEAVVQNRQMIEYFDSGQSGEAYILAQKLQQSIGNV